MAKNIVLFISGLLLVLNMDAQNIVGIWQGDLGRDGKELIVDFEILQGKDQYTSSLSCSKQQLRDLPASKTTFQKDSICITINRIAGEYNGVYNKETDLIFGTWKQGEVVVDLPLKRVEKKHSLIRPQTPLPPFPYDTLTIKIDNPKANVILDGLLTIPHGEGPFPAVVMVSGSGPQNKDEALMGHKPFLVISDYLARNGIASLRYDDRGVAKSGGTFNTATSFDLAEDAESVFSILRSQKGVDSERVGILGHSEGGMIAPIIAERNPQVKFVVLMAGPAVDIAELMEEQNRAIFKSFGMDSIHVEENARFNRTIYGIINLDVPDEMIYDTLRKTCFAYYETIPEEYKPLFGQSKEMYYFSFSSQLLTPWNRAFFRIKPKEYLSKITCPVLALFGGKDIQVDGSINAEAIKNTLNPNVLAKSEIVLYKDLNHLFQPAATGELAEYVEIETTTSPVVLEKMASFINRLGKHE